MARTVVWATQSSWQRLVGFAYTSEEDLLRSIPMLLDHVVLHDVTNATVKQEEDAFGTSNTLLDMEPILPRHKMPKVERSFTEGYQVPGSRVSPIQTVKPAGIPDVCLDPDCTMPAVESRPGLKLYCLKHSCERTGMMEDHEVKTMQCLTCQHPACDKFSTPAEDGDRTYCLAHMRQYGQQPVLKRRECQHPECQKQARKSSEGQTLYCKGHMKQHGLSPNVPKCRHVNCGKQAQLSVDGQTLFCKVHMKENGFIPRQRVCAEGNCQRRVKQSLQGPGMFCIAHMKLHGLTPKLRLCQNVDCCKQAVPDVEGKRLYCVAHMKEHGMEPYFRLRKCQAPNCHKKAMSDTVGKKTFCSFHAKVFEELQNSALANYQSDGDEVE